MTMERRLDNSRGRYVSVEVAFWRRNILIRAGFHPDHAEVLAQDARVDLHDILELVDRGCPPELAARILAPL
jgi:hypothetical protein